MQHANSIELWGAHTARTFRPVWVAEELELDYTLYPLAPRSGELQTPEYIQLNPRQKIPYMRDGELEISESLAISRPIPLVAPVITTTLSSNLFTIANPILYSCLLLNIFLFTHKYFYLFYTI